MVHGQVLRSQTIPSRSNVTSVMIHLVATIMGSVLMESKLDVLTETLA